MLTTLWQTIENLLFWTLWSLATWQLVGHWLQHRHEPYQPGEGEDSPTISGVAPGLGPMAVGFFGYGFVALIWNLSSVILDLKGSRI